MSVKQAEAASSGFDTVKLALAVLVLLAGIAGFYYFSGESVLYRALGLLAVAAVALVIFLNTDKGRALVGFLSDSRVEVRKMVWPTRQEAMQTTLIVMVLVLIAGIFFWLLDMLLGWAVKFVIGGA